MTKIITQVFADGHAIIFGLNQARIQKAPYDRRRTRCSHWNKAIQVHTQMTWWRWSSQVNSNYKRVQHTCCFFASWPQIQGQPPDWQRGHRVVLPLGYIHSQIIAHGEHDASLESGSLSSQQGGRARMLAAVSSSRRSAQKRVILPHLVQIKRIVFDLGVERLLQFILSATRAFLFTIALRDVKVAAANRKEQKGQTWLGRVDTSRDLPLAVISRYSPSSRLISLTCILPLLSLMRIFLSLVHTHENLGAASPRRIN